LRNEATAHDFAAEISQTAEATVKRETLARMGSGSSVVLIEAVKITAA
jgi:hypothetical protein